MEKHISIIIFVKFLLSIFAKSFVEIVMQKTIAILVEIFPIQELDIQSGTSLYIFISTTSSNAT